MSGIGWSGGDTSCTSDGGELCNDVSCLSLRYCVKSSIVALGHTPASGLSETLHRCYQYDLVALAKKSNRSS